MRDERGKRREGRGGHQALHCHRIALSSSSSNFCSTVLSCQLRCFMWKVRRHGQYARSYSMQPRALSPSAQAMPRWEFFAGDVPSLHFWLERCGLISPGSVWAALDPSSFPKACVRELALKASSPVLDYSDDEEDGAMLDDLSRCVAVVVRTWRPVTCVWALETVGLHCHDSVVKSFDCDTRWIEIGQPGVTVEEMRCVHQCVPHAPHTRVLF